MLAPNDYYQLVRNTFQEKGKPDVAQMQMWYMKHQFEFFGLKMPQWMALTKVIHKEHGLQTGEALKTLVGICFEDDHREIH